MRLRGGAEDGFALTMRVAVYDHGQQVDKDGKSDKATLPGKRIWNGFYPASASKDTSAAADSVFDLAMEVWRPARRFSSSSHI